MKFVDVEIPVVAGGRVALENPFMEVVSGLATDFNKGKKRAVQFVESGSSKDVGRWSRQLAEAGKEFNKTVGKDDRLTVRKTVEPRVSTAATPGVDAMAERTVTFWVAKSDGRGAKSKDD